MRIKEVESVHHEFIKNYSYEKKEQESKIKNKIYQDVEHYLKKIVERFTESLSHDRMSPMV